MKFLTNIDLNKNELQNAVLQLLATAPSSPTFGQIYVNSATKKIMWYNGTEWQEVGTIYTLPTASASTLGGVKVGAMLTITDGVLSANQQTENSYTTAEKNKLAGIAAGAQVNPTKLSELTNDTNFITIAQVTKANVGLSNVTNDAQVKRSEMGQAGGVATLDNSGKVPSTQLPSYVDDVLEYNSLSAFPATGETGKIYIAKDTNKTYRWSGTQYTEISASLALGETSSMAYRGDRGKTAYDHSQATHAPTNAQKNVQSDWSATDTGSDAFIKNKPALVKVKTETMTNSASKTITVTGSIVNVVCTNSNNEVVLCDVDITSSNVVVSTATAQTLTIKVYYI